MHYYVCNYVCISWLLTISAAGSTARQGCPHALLTHMSDLASWKTRELFCSLTLKKLCASSRSKKGRKPISRVRSWSDWMIPPDRCPVRCTASDFRCAYKDRISHACGRLRTKSCTDRKSVLLNSTIYGFIDLKGQYIRMYFHMAAGLVHVFLVRA